MKAIGDVVYDSFYYIVPTSEQNKPIGNGWAVGDVIDVIFSLYTDAAGNDASIPGPWIVRRVWYEDGAWRMEAEREARL